MRRLMTRDVDIAIVGSGFSGSLLAMIARRLGRSVVLLERGHHPRFAIGESSTPLASLLLEEMARRYDLPRLIPLGKYGSWRRAYPDVGCGLKRGFSFFRHEAGSPFAADAAHGNQLLVAASPRDDIGDVHWYRPDLDHFLVREAVTLGAEYIDGVELTSFSTGAAGAHLEADGLSVRARLVVDASGPRGFLHRQLGLGERALPGLPATQTLFTHFTGVRRFADVVPNAFDGGPPYAPDDAAVHHVFDGGWIWVLRFDNGITSAGIAATEPLARELRLPEGAAAWDRLLARFPSIGVQFADATPTRDFTWWPRLSFFSDTIAGDGWVALPSAAGIVDPLLSTGFLLTLLGVQRVAQAIAEDWGSPRLRERLQAYAARTAGELETTSRLVGALYDAFGDWHRFTSLTFLYFAAASFAESARRLGNTALSGDGFLLDGHPAFGPALRHCLELAAGTGRHPEPVRRAALLDAIAQAIEPVNVAGLARADRHNWYPAEAGDLFAGADKLGASESQVQAMLERCGFTVRAAAAGP
ncbi:MAG: FAD-dependent oxidoreductase [Gemmatimonadota bacterium]